MTCFANQIDASPDLREQLLDTGLTRLDAVLVTHSHADHTHGIDDVRPLVIKMKRRIDIHMDEPTSQALRAPYIARNTPEENTGSRNAHASPIRIQRWPVAVVWYASPAPFGNPMPASRSLPAAARRPKEPGGLPAPPQSPEDG